MAQDITLTELIDMLSELFTNMNNLDKTYYDMFYNPNPLDITLERYDEDGVLQKVVLPNRAKDKDAIITGSGDPEGVIPASIGKLYIDTVNSYLYYKTQGTATAPTATGWMLIFTTINAGTTFQLISEKGQANGYAPLNENKKVPSEYLEASELTYYDTKTTCLIEIMLKTILTWECSNVDLDFETEWTGTDADIGVRTIPLTENTLTEHSYNKNLVTVTGSVSVDKTNGKATGFSASNYLTTGVSDTTLNITLGTSSTVDETLTVLEGKAVTVECSKTNTTVETNREDLVAKSTFTGTKEVGTQTDTVTYKSKLDWHITTCVRQGSLTVGIDGIVSGFGANSYLAPTINWDSTSTLKIVFNTGDDVTTGQALIGNNMSVAIKDGQLGYNKLTDKTFSPVVEVTANTDYYLTVTYDSTAGSNVVSYSTDDTTYTQIVPGEAASLFLLGTLATGKGVLDGEDNVTFLGTVNALESKIITGVTENTFADVTQSWYSEAGIETTLDAHDLSITSGTPTVGDTITATYTTNAPMINGHEITLGATYNFQYVADDTDTSLFYPQIEIAGVWESAGDAVTSTTKKMNIGKGVFTGSVNLLESFHGVSDSLATTTVTYRWYDSTGVQRNLKDLGATLISGTPLTGDVLTLIYTTTEY